MAMSAFKSNSKRGNLSPTSRITNARKSSPPTKNYSPEHLNKKKLPVRRSRSVSALKRTHFDANSEFLNTRDNPLFWSDVSPRSDEELAAKIVKLDDVSSNSKVSITDNGADSRRGRPNSRNSDVDGKSCVGGGRKGVGRSLSRVDTCRRRSSVSRGHYGNYEREHEQDSGALSDCRRKSKLDRNLSRGDIPGKGKIPRSASDLTDILRGWPTWSDQRSGFETSDESTFSLSCSRTFNWEEDGESANSISEDEEKTILPDLGHVKVIQRSSSPVSSSACVIDIPPDLMNLSAEESVAEVRGEYAWKLEASQERARKLRAELAVEEHRELELSEILKEMTIDPNTPTVQKPRAGRIASIERKKWSKRLKEDAMAYFDECVSISTFDDSEFSSVEDPPLSTVEIHGRDSGKAILPEGSVSGMGPIKNQGFTPRSTSPVMGSNEDYGSTANGTGNEICSGRIDSLRGRNRGKGQFSFGQKSGEASALRRDIQSYVKLFSKENKETGGDYSQRFGSRGHDMDAYTSKLSTEKLLMDRMEFRNRIESGSLLLCGGSWESSWAPFSPFL